MNKLKDEEGWEEVRRKKGKMPMSGSDGEQKLNIGGKRSAGYFGGTGEKHAGVSTYAGRQESGRVNSRSGLVKGGNASQHVKANVGIKFTVSEDAKKFSYLDAIKTGKLGETGNLDLEFIEPVIVDGKRKGILTSEALREAEGGWNHCLLMYVVGHQPFFKAFDGYSKRVRKTKLPFFVQSRDNGFFVVRFGSEEDSSRILNSGPWFFDKSLIIMKRLTPNMRTDRDLLTSMPIWIRLPGLSFNLWGNKAISGMVSSIGRPIRMDEATKSKTRIAFARVLVEVFAEYGLPNEIEAIDDVGGSFTQEIIYENPPPLCDSCVCFGHLASQCPMVKKWVQKESQVDNNVNINIQVDKQKETQTNNNTNINIQKSLQDVNQNTNQTMSNVQLKSTEVGPEFVQSHNTNVSCLKDGSDIIQKQSNNISGLKHQVTTSHGPPETETHPNNSEVMAQIAEAIEDMLDLQKILHKENKDASVNHETQKCTGKSTDPSSEFSVEGVMQHSSKLESVTSTLNDINNPITLKGASIPESILNLVTSTSSMNVQSLKGARSVSPKASSPTTQFRLLRRCHSSSDANPICSQFIFSFDKPAIDNVVSKSSVMLDKTNKFDANLQVNCSEEPPVNLEEELNNTVNIQVDIPFEIFSEQVLPVPQDNESSRIKKKELVQKNPKWVEALKKYGNGVEESASYSRKLRSHSK